ncbi:hypothetical protein HYH03_014953 [Edaphochlamys debaryana]|uniref:Uncharacterized protein n=1 Tax=Edaphochlamys debaryana TaxID=47281 RepID=A0A836BT19_9CHLO|nr:hypothetical protein HYH03_014953 [Edaphochlamys debaryana]|eukprot:KAG2486373.1 hypothetical protein HYH03_014953 [Edaphochlamys debaryana]
MGTRPPYTRVRFVKTRPRKRSAGNGANQVHDEDVLRWQKMVSEHDAVLLAQQAGMGGPTLPASQHPPTFSTDPVKGAIDYLALLPDDAKQSLYKHVELASRNHRLILEGQERLKYVQAEVKRMKAMLPPPPPPPPPHQGPGPPVDVEPVPEPSCWASCCGLLPPPPPPPPPAVAPLARMAVALPPVDYFAAKAKESVAARRKTQEQSAGGALQQRSYGGASEASLHYVGSSVGGASEGGAAAAQRPPGAALAPPSAADAPPRPGGDGLEAAAELPGQLDKRTELVEPPPPPAPPPAAEASGQPLLPPPSRPPLAPLQGKAPGAPQSLLRPLAPLAPPGAGAGAQRKPSLPSLGPPQRAGSGGSQQGSAPAQEPAQQQVGQLGKQGQQGQPGPPYDLSRYQDPASLERITQLQALQRGKQARRQAEAVRAQRGSQQAARTQAAEADDLFASAAAELDGGRRQPPPPPPGPHPFEDPYAEPQQFDLSRYQDPESIAKIERIQAAARGRQARQQVKGIRAAQGPRAPAAPPSVQAPAGDLYGGEQDPYADQQDSYGRPQQPPQGQQQQKQPYDPYDLSRYQDPESIAKIERIQAAARGRQARRQVDALKAAQRPRASTAPARGPQTAAPDEWGPGPQGPEEGRGYGQEPAVESGQRQGQPGPPYDLSRYQDPASLERITQLQALQRGKQARRQAEAVRAQRGKQQAAPPPPPQQQQQQQWAEVEEVDDW